MKRASVPTYFLTENIFLKTTSKITLKTYFSTYQFKTFMLLREGRRAAPRVSSEMTN
jgi:hypothetical protein